MKATSLYILLILCHPSWALGGTGIDTEHSKSPSISEQYSTVSSTIGPYGKVMGVVQTTWGKPLVNRKVHLLRISGETYTVFRQTFTDSEGRWVIEDVPPGFYDSWVGDAPNTIIGVGNKREVSAGKTASFGTHMETLKDDSTPRDIARRDATPYRVGSSKLLIDGFYVYRLRDDAWSYLRFYADGTIRSFTLPTPPDKSTQWFKEYPYGGNWGQFRVNGSNVLITTSNQREVRDKWNCTLSEQGNKFSFSREMRIGNSTSKESGTMSFFHDSILND